MVLFFPSLADDSILRGTGTKRGKVAGGAHALVPEKDFALIRATEPRWVAVATDNIHMKTSQEQK